jgi:hypothetical protein
VNGTPKAEWTYGESAVLTKPDAVRYASACAGTGVTGKSTLPPDPMTVVDVVDVGTGMVVVGTVALGAGL